MKKICFVLLAAALALGMTKCKKNDITPNSDGDTVFMTLEASCGGGRTIFDPSVPGIRWSSGATEYISVGSSVNGYLGELSGKSQVSTSATNRLSTSATNRLSFSGTINAPAGTPGEKLYFFYLGNGRHKGTTTLNFSNQENSGGAHFVTDFVIAIGEGTVTNSGGSTYTATADLEIKTAIAYFNINAFSTESDSDSANGVGAYFSSGLTSSLSHQLLSQFPARLGPAGSGLPPGILRAGDCVEGRAERGEGG